MPGATNHTLVLTNASFGADLSDVNVAICLIHEDGQQHRVEKHWYKWANQEALRVDVPTGSYQRGEMKGTARSFGGLLGIENEWVWSTK